MSPAPQQQKQNSREQDTRYPVDQLVRDKKFGQVGRGQGYIDHDPKRAYTQ